MYFYLLMSKHFIVITLLCVSFCMEFDKVLKDKNIIKVPRLIYFLFSIY